MAVGEVKRRYIADTSSRPAYIEDNSNTGSERAWREAARLGHETASAGTAMYGAAKDLLSDLADLQRQQADYEVDAGFAEYQMRMMQATSEIYGTTGAGAVDSVDRFEKAHKEALDSCFQNAKKYGVYGQERINNRVEATYTDHLRNVMAHQRKQLFEAEGVALATNLSNTQTYFARTGNEDDLKRIDEDTDRLFAHKNNGLLPTDANLAAMEDDYAKGVLNYKGGKKRIVMGVPASDNEISESTARMVMDNYRSSNLAYKNSLTANRSVAVASRVQHLLDNGDYDKMARLIADARPGSGKPVEMDATAWNKIEQHCHQQIFAYETDKTATDLLGKATVIPTGTDDNSMGGRYPSEAQHRQIVETRSDMEEDIRKNGDPTGRKKAVLDHYNRRVAALEATQKANLDMDLASTRKRLQNFETAQGNINLFDPKYSDLLRREVSKLAPGQIRDAMAAEYAKNAAANNKELMNSPGYKDRQMQRRMFYQYYLAQAGQGGPKTVSVGGRNYDLTTADGKLAFGGAMMLSDKDIQSTIMELDNHKLAGHPDAVFKVTETVNKLYGRVADREKGVGVTESDVMAYLAPVVDRVNRFSAGLPAGMANRDQVIDTFIKNELLFRKANGESYGDKIRKSLKKKDRLDPEYINASVLETTATMTPEELKVYSQKTRDFHALLGLTEKGEMTVAEHDAFAGRMGLVYDPEDKVYKPKAVAAEEARKKKAEEVADKAEQVRRNRVFEGAGKSRFSFGATEE